MGHYTSWTDSNHDFLGSSVPTEGGEQVPNEIVCYVYLTKWFPTFLNATGVYNYAK